METLNSLEKSVLEKLLAGKSEMYQILQKQLYALRVKERKMTGVGFFTRFSFPDDVRKLPGRETFDIGDVSAELQNLKHGAGFVLFIDDGLINMLEGFTYDEPWPHDISNFHLYYNGTSERT